MAEKGAWPSYPVKVVGIKRIRGSCRYAFGWEVRLVESLVMHLCEITEEVFCSYVKTLVPFLV